MSNNLDSRKKKVSKKKRTTRKSQAVVSKPVSVGVVNKRMMEIIETRILLEEKGFDNLIGQLREEFPNNKFDKRKFKNRIYQLLFVKNKAINSTLRDVVKMRLSKGETLENFATIYSYIPVELVERRIKWHKGLVSGRAKKLMGKDLSGIGRIDLSGGSFKYRVPETSFEKPCVVKTNNIRNPSIMFLNGANLGLKFDDGDIVGNVARRALSDAEMRKDIAVVLTNFLCLDLKKAGGPAKTARAQILGDNINPELIQNKDYRKVVENILATYPDDQVAFRTTEELVNDVLGGWIKVCMKPAEETNGGKKEEPEYSGPIYVIVGFNERALIDTVTYWEIWKHVKKEQSLLDDEIRIAKKSLAERTKTLERYENEELDTTGAYQDASVAEASLDSLIAHRARVTITNVANQESQRFFKRAYSVVVSKIEDAIPNAKVIGEGTSYIKVKNEITKIHVPSHRRVGDSLLSEYATGYGPEVLREQNPRAVVICHPFALQFRVTQRETDHDGERDSSKIFVAPIAIDDIYLRLKLTTLTIKDHPMMKAIYNHTFRAGVLRLRYGNKVVDADDLPVGSLESFKNYPKKAVTKKTEGSAIYNRGPKFIWAMICSDHHWGGRAKEFVWAKVNGVDVHLGMAEAVFHSMRMAGLCENNNMPVHFMASPDDPVQAQNVKYRTEPHPQEMSANMIEAVTGEILKQAQNSRKRNIALGAAEKIRRIYIDQLEKRGSDYLLTQLMQMMERHIEPNLDIFSAILRRAQSAKILLQGVGDIVMPEYGRHDTRNIGMINIGTGNHFSKTTDGEMIEGPLYAQRMRDLLLGMDEWREQRELINQWVLAPVYGKTCIGWGVISVKDGHKYGIEIRSAPNAMSGWGDTLRGHVRRDLQRGNYSRIWNKKLPVLKFFGDKHFFGGVSTSYSIYHMGPAGVHTNGYGENGFPPNSTGVSFLGIPVDGPDSGPLLWRCLPYDVIKSYVETDPRPFDWNEYLPNPA
ncbi:hypothetical protein ACFLZC_02785 [Patescibacteria group bacterium]